ncbi:MAG TPA: hypothetical protein VGC08_11755 [Pedobacter sp.]
MKKILSIVALILGVTLCFYMGSQIASAYGHAEYSTALGVVFTVLAFIPKGKEAVAYEVVSSPDLSAIARYAFSNKIKLLRRFYNDMAIAKDITLMQNVKNAIPLPMLVINGQPRPYTGNFSANAGDVAYTDRELTVGDFQRDFQINPGFYRNTYLAEERGPGEGAKNMKIPFAQFTTETAIAQNSAQLNNKTAFYGVGKAAFSNFNAATAYAAGSRVKYAVGEGEPHYYTAKALTTAGETPVGTPLKWELSDAIAFVEGLGTKIKAARTSGKITSVSSTGAITTADAFEQALMVYRNLATEVKDNATDIFLYVASNVIDMISDSFKDDIKKYTDADGVLSVLPRTEGICKLKKATWMAGSNMMIATPKSNLYMGTDLLTDVNDLKTIEQMYHLDMSIKGVLGFEFADEQAISLNDQN